uniref:FAR1 domain-containing protein n=1 Tax=Oryza glaberrima TaxID=4538 RepID=I1QLU3_ORYGL
WMIPAINLDYTFDFETMYTAGDAGSLQAHNVANDEMQVFEANDEMQVFATNDEMQVFEANDEMQVFEEMSDHADTMHTSVATGATTATANTISSQDSGTDDSEAQSAPLQDIPCSTQVSYLILTFNSEKEARAHYNRYAKRVGFSIKINTARKSTKDGERDK